jgi:hypothetical protein
VRWACVACRCSCALALAGCVAAVPALRAHEPFPKGPCLHEAPETAARPGARHPPPSYYWLGHKMSRSRDDLLRVVRADPGSAREQREADRHRLRFDVAAALTVVGGVGGAVGLGEAADRRGDPNLWIGAGVMAGAGVALLVVEGVLLLPPAEAHERAAVRLFNQRADARGLCPEGVP